MARRGRAAKPARICSREEAEREIAAAARLGVSLIALVGSRNASAAGVKFADRIARDLGDAGFVVVSGLARGIDAAAHRATVSSGTIAVLAGGHDHIYPPEHVDLLGQILENGAAVERNADGMGAARPRLSAPQPADLRSCRSASSSSKRRGARVR